MLTGILAFFVDCIIGDPKSKWHPVVLMGNLISLFERLFYHPDDKDSRKFAWGAVLVLLVLWLTYAVAEGIMLLSYKIPWSFGSTAVGAVMLSFAISPKSLAKAGKELYGLLLAGDMTEARRKVGWIVGRDTDKLDEPEIAVPRWKPLRKIP